MSLLPVQPLIFNFIPGGIPIFCDINKNNLNLNVDEIESLISEKTKAIIVVDYGGVPNEYEKLRGICDKYELKLISDCAHCIDGKFKDKRIHEWSDFTIYSFQAIKTMTTGDGGMLICSRVEDTKLAKKYVGLELIDKKNSKVFGKMIF